MKQKIKKILIANRGEIAIRVARTCQSMGIITVGVYSAADENSLHTEKCDYSVYIGEAPSTDSYLRIDKILDIAKEEKVDAIHPGYGFLSENAEFAKRCEESGIIFIGPKSETIHLMGLKNVAKNTAKEAGVPVIPGYDGEVQDVKKMLEEAKRIGFPVLIKASAGGGGKGMSVVQSENDFESLFEKTKREANSSFGNNHVMIERYFPNSKHIEVQVFGDGNGNAIHFFERECSLQRRHQKIIEEAPSITLTEKERDLICSSAVSLARSVNYRGAGTVEYIFNIESREFFFLEMNTRLQVEHPVSEEVTGFDLVKLQIKVAENKNLPNQGGIKIKGHSIECRLYAEDVNNNFLPCAGEIHFLDYPENIRIENSLHLKDEVSIYYDPMIAKLICSGETRDEAILKMNKVLLDTHVWGIKNNLDHLRFLINSESFNNGLFDTKFVESSHYSFKFFSQEIVSCAWLLSFLNDQKMIFPKMGFRNIHKIKLSDTFIFNESEDFKLEYQIDNNSNLIVNDNIVSLIDLQPLNENVKKIHFRFENKSYSGLIGYKKHNNFEYEIYISLGEGLKGTFYIQERLNFKETTEKAGAYQSPMPGKIVKVFVNKGQKVKQGEKLLILEAMKMENEITAFSSGEICEVFVNQGDQVDSGKLLIQMSEK